MPRLTLLGGGGFRVPLVYRALARGGTQTTRRLQREHRSGHGSLRGPTTSRARSGAEEAPAHGVDEIVLYDTDEVRLSVIERVLAQLAAGLSAAPRLHATTDLDEALAGARFVFVAVRVGGLAGRTLDERLPIAEGLIGQETTGPGGVCYGLRTVPVLTELAERIAARCPAAWVVNFTNPAGMVTEAMRAVLGHRVIGICDSPVALARRVAYALGVDPATTSPRYFGLNHLGWLRGLVLDGRDLLPDLLADDALLESFEEGRLFGAAWLRALGMIPNEYLVYYYRATETARSLRDAAGTRGELLRDQQERFYTEAAGEPERALDLWEATRKEREATYFAENRPAGEGRDPRELEAGGYEGVAVALMSALATGRPTELVLNVDNAGVLPFLDDHAVVEVPCLVDAGGARPLAVGPVPGHAAGLMQTVKSVERDTIAAAMYGDSALALRALGTHPLVGSVAAAGRILDAYLSANPELALRFAGDGSGGGGS